MGKKLTYEYVKNYIEIESGSGCKLVSDEYTNNCTPLKLICPSCNNEFTTTFSTFRFKKKYMCNKCKKEQIGKMLNYDHDYIKECFKNRGFKLISTEYKNNRERLTFCDYKGYYYYMSYTNFQYHKNPFRFHKSNPYTIQNIRLWCKENKKPFKLISEIYIGKENKLKWKCLKNDCGEEFLCSWNNIRNGKGCGVCHGKQVTLSNCLATINPDIIKEWHSAKNGNLTPYDVTPNSNLKVWWQCSKNPKHEWRALICSRNKEKKGCPYCSGMLPSEDYNLLTINPEICEEWDYVKNKKNPEEYCPNSGKKVWWKCSECNHVWMARIADRNKDRGCPECNKSKGEKRIKKWLDDNNIKYERQKEFEGLLGYYTNLSFDFYLPKYNVLIENQGIQHEMYRKGFHKNEEEFKKQLIYDKRKKKYAQKHGILLLEIWYYDFDNIEQILENYFQNININKV